MKIIEELKPKVVTYFSMELMVPYFTKYIAADKDGTLIAFANEPRPNFDENFSVWIDPEAGDLQLIATVALENFLWTDTLQAV